MKKLLAGSLLALALGATACGAQPQSAPPPSTTPHVMVEPFLPVYLDIIKGAPQLDNACHPTDLAGLLMPCDQPGE